MTAPKLATWMCLIAVWTGFVIAAQAGDENGAVDSDGLLLNYDFGRGSLPDAQGRSKDLTQGGIDAVIRPTTATPLPAKRTGWLEHRVLQRDGRGGWVSRPAKIQALRHPTANMTMPFGLVRMDNGELALQCSAEGKPTKPMVAFSRDDGDTWTDFIEIPGASGRPMLLTDQGGGTLSFVAGRHHANLQRLPSGDLVCTMVVRDDVDGLEFASDRRGCDALVSRDNGQTWSLDSRYELDAYRYEREDGYWVDGKCGTLRRSHFPMDTSSPPMATI
ncbi:MAG: hypothetical protein CMJ64_26310 [Planctomycetaceae bacterium]|nr:hypothetical protein [Planctomycetaceae bacterium]